MNKARIFISYAREDERAVRQLYWKLLDAGFQPWLDKIDLLPGEDWRLTIEKALRAADFVILCLSKVSAQKRGPLQRELKLALDLFQEKLLDDIYLIPARLEPCELPKELSHLQWMDLFDEDEWPRLVRSLHEGMKRLGKVPGAHPQPAPASQPAKPDLLPYITALSLLANVWQATDQSSDVPLLRTYRFETVGMDARGRIIERREGQAEYFSEDLGQGVALEMVEIPGGTFLMGTSEAEARQVRKEYERYIGNGGWVNNEMPQHRVSVPPLFIGKFQITQKQWRVVAELPKERFKLEPKGSGEWPVVYVSWRHAKEFCERLSRLTGRAYRLLSEAEWEYACRAGTTTPFAFGETITPQIVNYHGDYPYASAPKGEYRRKAIPVGSLGVANGFGLYDMHGNVWEWCEDVWHDNYNGAPTDGSARLSGGNSRLRVMRGGSWDIASRNCCAAYRTWHSPISCSNETGLRVAVAAR